MKGFKLFISSMLTLLFISGGIEASTDFSTGVVVNSRSGDQKDPALTMDNNGTLYAVWVDYNTTANLGDIYFSKSVDGGSTWSTEVQVDGGTTTRADQPAIAVDTSGIIHVVWRDFRNDTTNGDIFFSRSVDGGLNFSSATGINDAASDSVVEDPAITAGPSGRVYVTWRDERDRTNGDIYFDKSTNYGSSFGTDILIVDGVDGRVEKPSISVDSGGRVYIAWADFRIDTTGGNIYIRSSTDGTTFVDSTRVDDGSGSASAKEPSVFGSTINTTDVYVAWTDGRTAPNNGDIFFAISTNNGLTFGSSAQIDDSGTNAADEPVIVVSNSARVYVAWRDFRNGDPDIFFARSNEGGTIFSHGIRVNRDTSGTGIVQLFPSLTVDTANRAYAVWQDGRDGNFSIYSAKSPKLVTPLAPTGLTATAGDTQVTLDWSNNTESDLSGYNVYRSTTSGGSYTKLNVSLLTSSDYVSTGLTNGTKYYFVVTAVDTAANESGNSDEVNATPGNPSAPASPTGLTATAGATTVDLSWTAPTTNSDGTTLTDLAGYNVYRSIVSGGGFSKINTSTITVTTYQDTGRTSGTTYYYKVSAIDTASNESALTSAVSATPQTRGSDAAPSAPTGLSARTGSTIVDLSWTAPATNQDGTALTDLAGYNVYRSISSGGAFTKINSSTVTVTTFQDTGRTNGTTYYYMVTAIDDDSIESNFSNEVSATPESRGGTNSPNPPTGLTATGGNTIVDLAWTAPTTNVDGTTLTDLSGYNVYRSITSFGGYTKANSATVTATTFQDTGRTNGVTYYYVVTALDSGSNESLYSNEVYATPQVRGGSSAPARPTGLTATAGNTRVDLAWTAPTTNQDGTTLTDLSGYNVYRSINSDGGFTKINTSTVTPTTFQDTGLTNGVRYYYVVTAIDASNNESYFSTVVGATPQVRGSTAAPSAPAFISTIAGNATVDLTWTTPTTNGDGTPLTDLAGYNIYRSIISGGAFAKINSSTLTGTAFQDTGLTNGVRVYYAVTALDTSDNESSFSSETNATPESRGASGAPSAPTSLTATAGNTLVDLGWTAPTTNKDGSVLTDLAGYNVYRSIISGGGYTKINTSTVTAITFQDTGRTNGVRYYYAVTAIDGSNNESSYSVETNAVPQERGSSSAPSAPTGLTATAGSTVVDLTWTAPTTNQDGTTLTDLAGYNIYRRTGTSGVFGKINSGLITTGTHHDTDLTNGTTYYYKVTAVDTSDNESNFSGEANTTPQERGSSSAPSAPTGPTATGGSTIVDLAWTAPTTNQNGTTLTDLAGYNIYRRTGIGGVFSKVNSSLVTSATFQDTSLTNGTTYYYKVTAVDTSNNESDFSETTNATPQEKGSLAAPAKPTGLTATAGNTIVDLAWTAPTANQDDTTLTDLAGYNIYRRTGTGGVFSKVNSSLVTIATFQDTDLTNGTTYYYKVTAVDTSDNESNFSGEANATPQEKGSSLAPSAPTGLIAAGGSTIIDLSWTSPTTNQNGTTLTDLAGYNIYRRTGTGGVFSKINSSLVTEAAFQDTDLTNGTTYYYRVTAIDTSNNESDFSGEANATPQERGSSSAPSAPTDLTAAGGSTIIDLTWTAPTTNQDGTTLTDLAGYNVYRRTGTSGVFSQINSSLVTIATHRDTELTNGTTYYYKVTAIDTSNNESDFSGEANATPQERGSSLSPSAPTGLTATGGSTIVDLAWTAPTTNQDGTTLTDLAGYNVYRRTGTSGVFSQINSSLLTDGIFEDTDLTDGTTYYYKVTAIDEDSNESNFSDMASATPSDSAPVAPENLIATGASDKVTLAWDANAESDLAGYNIYRSTTSGSGYSKLNSSLVTTNIFEDTGLTALIHYFYVVTAVDNGDNESGNSNEVDVRGTSEGGGTEGGGGGCFIATATYGSKLAPEVQILCEFRDSYLLGNMAGKSVVSVYYKYGPYLAHFVENSPSVKSILKGVLQPLIWSIKR